MQEQKYTSDDEKLIFSHWNWMTEKEDARVCDMVDSIMQWDYE